MIFLSISVYVGIFAAVVAARMEGVVARLLLLEVMAFAAVRINVLRAVGVPKATVGVVVPPKLLLNVRLVSVLVLTTE